MSNIVVNELVKSRDQGEFYANLRLWAQVKGVNGRRPDNADAEDDEAVRKAFKDYVDAEWPTGFRGLVYQDLHQEYTGGNGIWFGEVNYGLANKAFFEQGMSDFEFDMTGGTRHIVHALQHIGDYGVPISGGANPGDLVSYDGAIGVTPTLSVEGCDIPEPSMSFNVTWSPPFGTITSDYVHDLFWAKGCMNSADWQVRVDEECIFTFKAHEALFLGLRGHKRTAHGWGLVYAFAGMPNMTDIEFPGGIKVDRKDGWDYIWPEYWPSAKSTNWLPKLRAMHVERVLREWDFNTFRLPNA